MMESVPQFIDVEDKVAGPFTGKQLLWLFGFATIAIVLWQFLEFGVFVVVVIPILLIFIAFMFYKPNGQSLLSFVTAAISFFFRPKIYVWGRTFHKKSEVAGKKQEESKVKVKQMSLEEMKTLSDMLDTRGGSRKK